VIVKVQTLDHETVARANRRVNPRRGRYVADISCAPDPLGHRQGDFPRRRGRLGNWSTVAIVVGILMGLVTWFVMNTEFPRW
jgi:hypothetical protein